MKFNFKKIASVIATTVMLGSTIAFSAAAWPTPFVSSGAADAAIVVGSSAAASDMAAATDLMNNLNTGVTATGSTTISGGDTVKLQRTSDMFNMNDQLDDFYATLDEEEFTEVLAKGIYLNDDNTEYKYEQSIALSAEALTFFQDSSFNDNKPLVGFNLDSSDHIMNYTLDFTPTAAEGGTAATFPKIDNTKIKMLGKEFYISAAETSSNGLKLTLLDAANTGTVTEGEETTIVVGDQTYVVSIDFIGNDGTNNEVKLNVNGAITNTLNKGETYKLSDGTYVGVKDISVQNYAGGVKKAEFTLGIGKVVLEDGEEVKLNDEAISTIVDANGYTSTITPFITNTSTAIDDIVLVWDLDDDAWIAPGTELVMPGFNAIKISMTNFVYPKQEKTTFDDASDSVRISTQVKDGDISFGILHTNLTTFDYIGEKSTHRLVTNHSTETRHVTYLLNESQNSYFVTTWISGDDAESYVYEITSITDNSGKNTTKLENLASGGSDLEFSEVTDTEDRGQITYTLIEAHDNNKWARVKATATSGTLYGDLLTTKEGLTLRLPVEDAAGNNHLDGNISFTDPSCVATWKMNFTEEDKDGNVYPTASKSFTITFGIDTSDGTEPTATSLTSYDEEDDSDWELGVAVTDLATKVRVYKPSTGLGKAEVIYAGDESYAEVYVAEIGATTSGTGKISVVKDSEVSSVSGKNLIVVGGSCINSVTATLLGSSTPLCGDAFSAKTGAGVGKYLVQVVSSTYAEAASPKIAMLVAGYEAADTTAAVAKVKEGKESTEVGSKVVYPLATA